MIESKVYIFTLLTSGVFYIGSTQDLDKRIKTHLRELKNGTHYNARFQNAWFDNEEYIINCFTFSTREEAYEQEEFLIKKVYNSERKNLLANTLLGSRFGDALTNHQLRDEILQKRIETQREQLNSMSANDKSLKYGKPGSRNGMYGKTHTPEVKAMLSALHTGHSYNKGIKLSQEHVEKIRIRQRLRTGSKNSFYGKQHSEETKRKLREINVGGFGHNRRSIIANGLPFNTCREAAKHFGISEGLVTHRLKKEKYNDWYYVDRKV